jgi:hypothetical protein
LLAKNCGGSTKISFKIAQRYLQDWEGHLSFARKNKGLKVAAMVVDNVNMI